MTLDTASIILNKERTRLQLENLGTLLRQRRDNTAHELRQVNEDVRATQRALSSLGVEAFSFGDFRTAPFSTVWGADRGRCVDRYYIEGFLERHRETITGAVLEVHDDGYTRQFGHDVTRSDVIDIDPTNNRATIVADLRDAQAVASNTYDCFIMTQTLHVIYEVRRVLAESVRILKPGGVLLATLACASRVAPEQGRDRDFWRFTEASARRLFGEFFAPDRLDVRSQGNVLVTIAYLYGLACHELEPAELEARDRYFPLIVSVCARKSAT